MPKAPQSSTTISSAPTTGPSKLSKAAKVKTSAKSSSLKPMTYSSFLPIPLSIPTPLPIPSSSTSRSLNAATHYLYARAHTKNAGAGAGAGDAQAQTLPTDRTVFVANIPVDMTEHMLRSVFGRWGVVERIQYSGGRGGDGLEMAVLGIEPDSDEEDEDEDEQDGAEGAEEGDAAEGGNGESGGGVDGVAAGAKFIGDATLPRRQRKRLNKLPSSVPIITPLPSLDPRSAANPHSLGDAYHPSGARCAHIIYLDSSPLSALLTTPTSPHSVIPIKPDPSVPTGLPYYLALHASLRPSLAAVRAFADTSMARFDHLSSLLLSSRAKAQGAGALVDEDGFTVVVRSGKGGRTGGLGDGTRKGTTSVGVASRGFGKRVKGGEVGVKKGKGAQELPDFYKFQKMERKRQELADLRNQFEKDKAKVAAMRHAKRFKPY